jgi:entericidin A
MRLQVRRERGPVELTRGHGPDSPATAKEIPMKRLIALMLLALFSAGTLTACNTMAGAGEDIQQAGDAMEEEAVDCKDGDTGDNCL